MTALKEEDLFDFEDFLGDILPDDFDVNHVLPDLGDIQFDVNHLDQSNINAVETLSSSCKSNTLESLLKSVPSTSCVPPAPQLPTPSSVINVISNSSGASVSIPHSIPSQSMLNCPESGGYTTVGDGPLVSSTMQFYPGQPIPSQGGMGQLKPEQQTNLIGQLLQVSNEQHTTCSSPESVGSHDNNEAARKLQLIRQLLEGDHNNSLTATSSPPDTRTINSAPSQQCIKAVLTTPSPKALTMVQTMNSNHTTSPPLVDSSNQRIHQILQSIAPQKQNILLPAPAPALTATLTAPKSNNYVTISPQSQLTGAYPLLQPANMQTPLMMSYSDTHGDDSSDEHCDNSHPSFGGQQRGGKRNSHNAIEKRYRRSINDKIDELRDMFTDMDGKASSKLSKSCVLKKALERMKNLSRENAKLREEVGMLRQARSNSCEQLETGSLSYSSPLSNASSSEAGSESLTSDSQPCDPSQSPPSALLQAVSEGKRSSLIVGAKRPALNYSSTGSNQKLARLLLTNDGPDNTDQKSGSLGTASRFTLCMFACMLLAFNPTDYLFQEQPSSYSGGVFGTTRRLMGTRDETSISANGDTPLPTWALLISYLAQWFVALYLIYRASRGHRFWGLSAGARTECYGAGQHTLMGQHWTQAQVELNNSAWLNAQSQLKACLIALGHPIPASISGWLILGFWNLVRLPLTICSHLLGHHREDRGHQQHLDKQNAESGVVLLCRARSILLQLSVLDLIPMSKWQQLVLTTSLYNQVISDPSGLTDEDLIEMDLCLGLALRKCAPFGFIGNSASRWFYTSALSMAQSACNPQPSFDWLRSNEGYSFLCDYELMADACQEIDKENVFTLRGQKWRLLDRLQGDLREMVMEKVLTSIASGGSEEMESAIRLLDMLDHLAMRANVDQEVDVDVDSGNTENTLVVSNGADNVCLWWSQMSRSAVLWHRECYAPVDSLHSDLTKPPDSVNPFALPRGRRWAGKLSCGLPEMDKLSSRRRLGGGVLLAYRTNRRALMGTSDGNQESGGMCTYVALQAANQSLALLKHELDKDTNLKTKIWRAIACTWLLNARASLGSSSEEDLSNYSATLNVLQTVVHSAQLNSKKWLLVHEATLRMLSGGNPLRTSLILRQCAQDPNERRLKLVKELIRNRALRSNGVRAQT